MTGLAITAGAAMLLATATGDAHYATDLLPGLVLLGLGIGMVFVPVTVTAMAGIPAQHAGMASGFLMTGHEVGAALGVAVLSAVATTAGSLTSGARHQSPDSPAVSLPPPSSPVSSPSSLPCGCQQHQSPPGQAADARALTSPSHLHWRFEWRVSSFDEPAEARHPSFERAARRHQTAVGFPCSRR